MKEIERFRLTLINRVKTPSATQSEARFSNNFPGLFIFFSKLNLQSL